MYDSHVVLCFVQVSREWDACAATIECDTEQERENEYRVIKIHHQLTAHARAPYFSLYFYVLFSIVSMKMTLMHVCFGCKFKQRTANVLTNHR